MPDTPSDKKVTPITPENFQREADRLHTRNLSDPEAYHVRTNRLMEEVLISLGYEEGVKSIRKGRRWYA
jgi:hypothetical protein